MTENERIGKLVMTAMMMCLIVLATMLFKIPIPFTQGYVHLGDAMIFLSVLLLGRKYGTIAAGVGSMLGDIIGGFAFWAPWTLIIKCGMAFIMGTFLRGGSSRGKEIAAMILGGAFMTAGYFATEGIMYGNFGTAALGIPWNIGQFAVGMILAEILSAALQKTPAEKLFTYKLKAEK